MKQVARLENWHIVTGPGGRVLVGEIYDHGRFKNGDKVTTSLVTNLMIAKGQAETRNTLYLLGKPDAFFMEWIADSKSDVASHIRKELFEAGMLNEGGLKYE